MTQKQSPTSFAGVISRLLNRANPVVPNWAVKRTPTRAMASPLSWPLLVPFSRCAPSGAAYLGR